MREPKVSIHMIVEPGAASQCLRTYRKKARFCDDTGARHRCSKAYGIDFARPAVRCSYSESQRGHVTLWFSLDVVLAQEDVVCIITGVNLLASSNARMS